MASYKETPTQTSSPSSSPDAKTPTLVYNKYLWGALIAFSLLGLIAALSYLYFKRRKGKRYANDNNLEKLEGQEEMLLRRFGLEQLELATNHFSRDWLIGSGSFGNVYRGRFQEPQGTLMLAVKTARSDSYTSTKEFRNEVRLVSKVKHRNLVSLVGYCEEAGPRGAKILVYEYVPNGSLNTLIKRKGAIELETKSKHSHSICQRCINGIAHLHEGMKPSIIHRDIKPSNILIGEGFEPKVSDFGLVKSGPVGDDSHVSSQIKGTPGYLDPAYCISFHLSPFSDVYSFGDILLQLISARPAVDTTRDRTTHHIIEWARPHVERGNVEEILDANLLLLEGEPCNMEMMLKMGQIGLKCVAKVPKERPTMTRVWQELEEALYSADSFVIHRQPLYHYDYGATSPSSISIDGVGFQRFLLELDSLSFQSASLKCLEVNSIVFDVDDNREEVLDEETRF